MNAAPLTLLCGSIAVAAIYLFLTTRKPGVRKKVKKGNVPGLLNLGNTCYINALLQGMASLPSFSQWLKNIKEVEVEDENCFLTELRNTVIALNDAEEITVSAAPIASSLAGHKWNIVLGVEQDLHELLNVFVTTWEEELTRLRSKRLYGPGLLNLQSNQDAQIDDTMVGSDSLMPTRTRLMLKRCLEASNLDSKIRSPCIGLVSTQLQCCQTGCLFKKVRQDRFSVISLSVPKAFHGNRITIESLLRKFFCIEVIRGATCDQCKVKNGRLDSGLIKKQGICMLPQVFMIRIERVGVLPSGNVFKLQEHVDFAEILDMRDFCFYSNKEEEYEKSIKRHENERHLLENLNRIVGGAEVQQKAKPWRINHDNGLGRNYSLIDGGSFISERKELVKYGYQLRAVSEHMGVPETGHFVTYRRGIGENQRRWFLTNDTQVTEVPFQRVTSAQAYMLYYERIQSNRWYSDRDPLLTSQIRENVSE
ncbi:unnamed protein product, partial [Mesorhabditis belari]|uniref:Ubiquitin carboxyl-terminal hydrolase n=1 Tax=Mesorhabditis belari TaxID=2138241 RepID=A0AAF3E9S5_9BILA